MNVKGYNIMIKNNKYDNYCQLSIIFMKSYQLSQGR